MTCKTLPWNTVGRCSVDLPGGEQLHGHGLEAQPENGLLLGHDCGARRSTQGQGAVGGTPPLAQSWGASHTLHSMVTGSSDTQGHAGALDTSWRHTGLVLSLLVHLRNFQSPGDFSFGRTFPPEHRHTSTRPAPPHRRAHRYRESAHCRQGEADLAPQRPVTDDRTTAQGTGQAHTAPPQQLLLTHPGKSGSSMLASSSSFGLPRFVSPPCSLLSTSPAYSYTFLFIYYSTSSSLIVL